MSVYQVGYSPSFDQIVFNDTINDALAGITEFTIALTLTPIAVAAEDLTICGQWGGSSPNQAWILNMMGGSNGGALGVAFGNPPDGGAYFTRITDLVLSNDVTYRIVVTMVFGVPPVMHIWINGVDESIHNWFAEHDITQMGDSNQSMYFGFGASTNGVSGRYSEIAIWSRVLTDAECVQYGLGVSPKFMRRGGLFYAPCFKADRCEDVWRGALRINIGGGDGTTDVHPRVFYPAPGLSGLFFGEEGVVDGVIGALIASTAQVFAGFTDFVSGAGSVMRRWGGIESMGGAVLGKGKGRSWG